MGPMTDWNVVSLYLVIGLIEAGWVLLCFGKREQVRLCSSFSSVERRVLLMRFWGHDNAWPFQLCFPRFFGEE